MRRSRRHSFSLITQIHHVGVPSSGSRAISSSIELLFEYEKMRLRLAGVKPNSAEDVVALGPVLGEIESLIFKNGDEIREPIHLLLAATKLVDVVEVREIRKLVRVRQRRDDFFIDLVADVALTLERDHILEAGAPVPRVIGTVGLIHCRRVLGGLHHQYVRI